MIMIFSVESLAFSLRIDAVFLCHLWRYCTFSVFRLAKYCLFSFEQEYPRRMLLRTLAVILNPLWAGQPLRRVCHRLPDHRLYKHTPTPLHLFPYPQSNALADFARLASLLGHQPLIPVAPHTTDHVRGSRLKAEHRYRMPLK